MSSLSGGRGRCTESAPALIMMALCGAQHRQTGRGTTLMTSGGTARRNAQGVELWRERVAYFPSPSKTPPTQNVPHMTIMALCGVHLGLIQGGTGGATSIPGVTAVQGVQVVLFKKKLVSIMFVKAGCHTYSGMPCMLPFQYNGTKHTQCAEDEHSNNDLRWCATELLENGTMAEGKWEYCAGGCS